ncbi:MAG: hypothetical protein WC247_12950 [Porticoccaceae bacterium]
MNTTDGSHSLDIRDSNILNFSSGVSWSAIFAGAAAAAALSLILLLLGTGFGLSAVSPWAQEGVSATTLSITSIVWITFMSLAASGIGGYLAGRLRTKWVGIHTDEVFFRDTAHGLLAWAVATLATATLLASAATAVVGGGLKAGAEVVRGTASAAATAASGAKDALEGMNEDGMLNYYVDSLFRDARSAARDNTAQTTRQQPTPTTSSPSEEDTDEISRREPETGVSNAASRRPNATSNAERTQRESRDNAEVVRIFINGIWQDEKLDENDLDYVASLIAERTELTEQQAQERVAEVYERLKLRLNELEESAKEAADNAKKASAYAALWFSFSLLVGAFVASLAATFGGRRRDL